MALATVGRHITSPQSPDSPAGFPESWRAIRQVHHLHRMDRVGRAQGLRGLAHDLGYLGSRESIYGTSGRHSAERAAEARKDRR